MRRPAIVLISAVATVWGAAALASAMAGTATGSTPYDPRSHELLRMDCSSRLAGAEVTLFANGTLRLRERREEETQMWLAELTPREAESYRARLVAEGSPGEQSIRRGVSGEWVDQCRLTLELEAGNPFTLRYSRVDTLPLTVSRLAAIADELLAEARERRLGSGFPVGYRVQVGDVVRRADGNEFVVRRFTVDGAGVELEGVQQPLVLYMDRKQVAAEFVTLVRRR